MLLQYRSALPSDANDCILLRGKTSANALSAERLSSIGITEGSWGDQIRSGALHGCVCTFEDQIVGYCFAAQETGEIVVLALLPDFENRGIGRELLRQVVTHLEDIGRSRLFLGCSPDPSSRSYGFYRHLGWHSTGSFDEYGDEILAFKRLAAKE